MTANQDIPTDLHIKVCKKIAQLTKVIYTLNSKAEEHDAIIEKLNEEHGKEIQNIMSQSKLQIQKFKAECQYSTEKEKELKNVQEMLKQVKEENERLQKTLREYLTNTELNEKQLRNGYENKFLELQSKFLECKTDYSELLDSCNKYPKDTEDRKQKQFIELTAKHKEDINNLQHAFERDLDTLKADKLKNENVLNKKIQSLEALQDQVTDDYKLKENEYESKISKLKQFYEEEIKLHKQMHNEANEKEWLNEKNDMISEFKLKKTELNNRVRYLEKTLEEKEIVGKELQKKFNVLQSEYDECVQSLTILQNNAVKKDKEISILRDDIKVLQNKTKIQFEKLNAATLSNDNYRQIEEAYGEVSKSSDEYKKRLTSLTLEYEQLEEIHHQLKSKFLVIEENNTKLHSLCSDITNEKTTVMNKSKTLEIELEEKMAFITSLEKKLAKLDEKYNIDREQCSNVEKELDDMKDMFSKANMKLQDDHTAELDKLNKVHVGKMKEAQEESSKLLEDQKEDFLLEKDKHEVEYNLVIKSKDELIVKIKKNLEQSESNLNLARSELEKNEQQNKLLKGGLHDKGKMIEDTIGQYELKISDIKIDFQNQNEKMNLEFENMKEQITNNHNDVLEKLERKWQQRLKNALEESEELAKQRERNAEQQLNAILSKHHSELSQLKLAKDGEIQMLKIEIEEFKAYIVKMKTDSSDTEKRHDEILNEKLEYFKSEKENLRRLHNKEIADLKDSMRNEMDEKMKELESEKDQAFEILKHTHETNVMEIRSEHLQSLKVLRSQLNLEKEEAVSFVRCQLNNDKQQLHDILKVQTEEKIKSITRDYEAKLVDSKAELEQSFQLRQQEFLVHSRKISELTKGLEEEKSHVKALMKKLSEAEDKERCLSNELTGKGEEILEIRRESNFKLRSEMDKVGSAHKKEKEMMVQEFYDEKMQNYEDWENMKAELTDQISSLKIMLDELEEKFMQRPSREEDIEKLNDLTQKLFERELECRRLSEERKHYRLELVNREENFNKVFNNSPNVGYINPIELSKRKSSKKR